MPDEAGLNFLGSICLVDDHRFLEYILDKFEKDPENIKEVTGIEDLNREMNMKNQMLQISPLTCVLVNGSNESCL